MTVLAGGLYPEAANIHENTVSKLPAYRSLFLHE